MKSAVITARCEDTFGFAMTVTRLNFPLDQLLEQTADGGLSPIFPVEKFMLRSQDMPSAYVDAGQAYFFKTARFLARETMIADDMAPVILPSEAAWISIRKRTGSVKR